jgi:hypothetical protein
MMSLKTEAIFHDARITLNHEKGTGTVPPPFFHALGTVLVTEPVPVLS